MITFLLDKVNKILPPAEPTGAKSLPHGAN